MTIESIDAQTSGHRGPADHAIRTQIIEAARSHFSHYGYNKTTVSDLAKAINFSKAYIYKFFESKEAIGHAICAYTLEDVFQDVIQSTQAGTTATEKLRLFFKAIIRESSELFFEHHKLYEIAMHSVQEQWPSCVDYCQSLEALLRDIILEGRASGEFERKTPLDETAHAIMQAMEPFHNPIMLQYKLKNLPDDSNAVVGLILRSLAP